MDDSFLNAINGSAVEVRNAFINSGFAGSGLIDGWLRIEANARNIITGNITNVSGTSESLVMPFGLVCDAHSPYTGPAPVTPNGGLISSANLVVSRVAPASAIVGVVLQAGTRPGGTWRKDLSGHRLLEGGTRLAAALPGDASASGLASIFRGRRQT